jgi:hypothetical protein
LPEKLKNFCCPTSLILIHATNKDLASYYDKLDIPKGPGLGTEFTLAMPYVYLAHYDKVRTPAGRDELMRRGIHPELLRFFMNNSG